MHHQQAQQRAQLVPSPPIRANVAGDRVKVEAGDEGSKERTPSLIHRGHGLEEGEELDQPGPVCGAQPVPGNGGWKGGRRRVRIMRIETYYQG